MILATFMYTTDIKPTTTTLMYIRYFLFPKYPTSILNNILLQYFRKMSLFHYWPSISICCVRPTYVVQQIVIKEFSLSRGGWRNVFQSDHIKVMVRLAVLPKEKITFLGSVPICYHLQSICIVLPCVKAVKKLRKNQPAF